MRTDDQMLADIKLLLNVKKPDFEDVYMEGYEYGQKNFTEAANPYKRNSREYQYWQEGWNAGFYNEEPLFGADSSEEAELLAFSKKPAQNDEAIASHSKVYDALVLLFKVMCLIFAGFAIYTVYDLSV